MFRRFYLNPYEAFIGVFVIVNGILTLSPGGTGSEVKNTLWNLLGGVGGVGVPMAQIIAGSAKLLGIAFNKSNLLAAGLIMVTMLFFIRAIALIADGNITPADINNEVIAVGIIVSNILRITQITNRHKYVVTQVSI